ncbi:MAG: NAD-dependent dihydropyrimidine dehydrogenase subunit PreA [Candidatus Eisenbacteria bacterium]
MTSSLEPGEFERLRRAALAEAERCLLCEDPPCGAGCPAGIDPRTFIRKIRFGDLAGAARHLRDRNILAGSCAELCPVPMLCVGRCLHEKLDRPIDIAGLQRFVCLWERLRGGLTIDRPCGSGPAVAVVGAGPAGLSCAAELARRGFAVTLFERERAAGGVLRAAIPSYRLPPEVLDYEIELVAGLGVTFRLGVEVKSAAELLRQHAAVYVATGAGESMPLRIAGESSRHVISALRYLRDARRGQAAQLGNRVTIIGGGNTAVDAARWVRRTGREATILYRRGPAEMPAYRDEVEAALREGVEMLLRVTPVEFITSGPEELAGVRLQRVRWHGRGRDAVECEAEGGPFDFPCDDVLVAAGLRPGAPLGLETDRQGVLVHDPDTWMTSTPGIFAGGDAATGPRTAVEAVHTGRAAAAAIEAHLCFPGRGRACGCTTHAADNKERGVDRDPAGGERPARGVYRRPRADLSVRFCGIVLENPFLLAAGPPTDDLEIVRNGLRAGWAGAVLKTTAVAGTAVRLVHPMMSAPADDRGRLQSLGNIDLISDQPVEVVAERVRALKREFPGKLIAASIMGSSREDWEALVRELETAGVDLIECSFSCPQGTLGHEPGAMLGQDAELVRRVAGWVKGAARRVPVVIKITPQVASIAAIAAAVREAGCDAICASNTIPALAGIDLERWVPYPDLDGASTYAGLSGPAIKPVTLRTIAEIARHGRLPITGTGGPLSWMDAVEFMLAGATTVQFCTAVMRYGFAIIEELREGLGDYLDRRGCHGPEELVGRALPNIVDHGRLPRRTMRARIDPRLCIGDGSCLIACRDGGHRAIRMSGERAFEVDPERCVGCGLCGLICPVDGCITLMDAERG